MRDRVTQPLGLRLLERQGRDAFAPQADVDAGRVGKCNGQGFVEVAGPQAEGAQGLVGALDLGSQDAGRRRRCRGRVGARLADQDAEAPQTSQDETLCDI